MSSSRKSENDCVYKLVVLLCKLLEYDVTSSIDHTVFPALTVQCKEYSFLMATKYDTVHTHCCTVAIVHPLDT